MIISDAIHLLNDFHAACKDTLSRPLNGLSACQQPLPSFLV
jgi:hypothetical protein